MFENRIKGLIVIFLILAISPFAVFLSRFFSNYKIPILANQNSNTVTVEIESGDIGKEIYFTTPGTTANQLVEMIGRDFRIERDFMLEDGMKLSLDSSLTKKYSLTAISNTRRLALGMPIDLNRATEEDLLLIQGIGEITAQKILRLRSKKGYFKNVEELMEMEGIKEKKLAKLKQYLYLQK